MWILLLGILWTSSIAVFGKEEIRGTYKDLHSCPESAGVHVFPHPKNCDQFYKCEHGKLSVETCENGLLFDGKGDVYNHCNYHWAVDCGSRIFEMARDPTSSCEYSYGVFKGSSGCSNFFYRCTAGIAEQVFCKEGLVYDERIHSCNWPDRLVHDGCNPEAIVGFRCPDLASLPLKSLTRHFLPYPRYSIPNDCQHYVTCVDSYPRLMACDDDLVFNDATLTCDEPQNVPQW